jgi:preprotein translocase subunit SecG
LEDTILVIFPQTPTFGGYEDTELQGTIGTMEVLTPFQWVALICTWILAIVVFVKFMVLDWVRNRRREKNKQNKVRGKA